MRTAMMGSPLNPWLRADDSSPSRHYPHDDDEARGLLDEDDPDLGRIPRYQSQDARRDGGSRSGAGAFLDSLGVSDSQKFRTFCPRISALLVAIVTLVLVIRATSPSAHEADAPLPRGAEGLSAVAEGPSGDSPSKPSSDSEDFTCSHLSPVAQSIVAWVESVAGYKLEPRSCYSTQRETSLTCPLPIPIILPPPLRPPTPLLQKKATSSTTTKRHHTKTASSTTNRTAATPSSSARRRLVSDEVACNQVMNWLRGYKAVFDNDVPTCGKSLIGTLTGTADTADGDILDLQLFGLPQIQQFEKFKLHPEWFTSVSKFGGGVGLGFQVFCNGEKLLSAGCGTGGAYNGDSWPSHGEDDNRITVLNSGVRIGILNDTYSTGWGGGVQLHFEKTGSVAVGLEGANSDLTTFYANLGTTQAKIKVCPKGALRIQGGASYGGDMTVNERKFSIGTQGEDWSMGTWHPPSPSKKEPSSNAPSFESALPDVEGLARPLLYSKRS